MAVVTTKSQSIINLDASPPVQNTIGEGGPAMRRIINDSVVGVVGDSIGSIYRLVRLPTNAKLKRLWLSTFGATGTSAGDIDVAFSDSPGESANYQAFQSTAGGVVQVTGPVDNKLFG